MTGALAEPVSAVDSYRRPDVAVDSGRGRHVRRFPLSSFSGLHNIRMRNFPGLADR
jgi:hypothetical protein